jgi:hypothetical protein
MGYRCGAQALTMPPPAVLSRYNVVPFSYKPAPVALEPYGRFTA